MKVKREGRRNYHKYRILIKPWHTGEQPSEYEKLAKNLFKENKDYKILIVYGAHFKENEEISRDYINDIKNIFVDRGFEVGERESGNPDLDFVFMSRAKNYVKSGGGYSTTVAEMVEHLGGRAIKDNFSIFG